jgi:hypothetical protein
MGRRKFPFQTHRPLLAEEAMREETSSAGELAIFYWTLAARASSWLAKIPLSLEQIPAWLSRKSE